MKDEKKLRLKIQSMRQVIEYNTYRQDKFFYWFNTIVLQKHAFVAESSPESSYQPPHFIMALSSSSSSRYSPYELVLVRDSSFFMMSKRGES